MNSQASYRKITSQLSRMTGSPCVTFHQRLAPQNPFPAALLDVFHGYLALLSPPPGSPHQAIPASSIVIAGDSSGGCLALSLLQVLLELQRSGISSVEYHGRKVNFAMPAGFTILSGVTDLTNALPSYKNNVSTDVFPAGPPPASLPSFPPCEIWPSTPPRGNLYCETEMMCHQITCPAMAEDWSGSPAVWFASGQEQIVDGVKVLAKKLSGQGVAVFFQEYELMPHCFMWALSNSPQYRKIWGDWSGACKMLLRGEKFTTGAELVQAKGLESVRVEIENLTTLTSDEARELIVKAAKTFSDFTGQKAVSTKL